MAEIHGAERDVRTETGVRKQHVAAAGGVLQLVIDGFPVLDEAFGTSVRGLYATGFLATQDFGPFFGFMRGAIVAASIIVDDVGRRLS